MGERYRLGRTLGEGGMAVVFLAEDLRHARRVAVKLLRPAVTHEVSGERFLREVSVTAQLVHPHILPLIDSGAAAGLLWYVMPYVEGESLRQRLAREGELPVGDALTIFREVVDALGHAHRHGIVHRDIKPENILLSANHAVVADFGVAKAVQAARGAALTTAGMAIGTPAYMAPEQAAGDPQVDARADLYAAGIVAYEMLAGRPPFVGANAQQLIAAHVTRPPEPLGRLRSAVPPLVEQVVMRCLEKRPADRWQSADALLRRLEAAIQPAAPVVRPDPVVRTFRLTEELCRRLDRSTLEPHMIGDGMLYLDNAVDSPVLLCFVHATGYDHRQYEPIVKLTPYRAVAPTLYGFEPEARRRVALGIDDHLVLLRAFLREAVERLQPEVTVLVGFSSGADVALRMAAEPEDAPPLPIDGLVSLGANLSLDTCFVTRLFECFGDDDPRAPLDQLRAVGAGAESLADWLNIHEYLVATLRKFQGDIRPLRRFARDIVAPFLAPVESPFARWHGSACRRVRRVRSVFEDTDQTNRPLRELRLRSLDEPVFGEAYQTDSIVSEPGTDHFDLIGAELMLRHVHDVVAALRPDHRATRAGVTLVEKQ